MSGPSSPSAESHVHPATQLPIRFATADDGTRIAFGTIGEGAPLVSVATPPINRLQLEWEDPARRHWYEQLSRHVTLIRYERRSSGLNDDSHPLGSSDAFSLHAQLRDLHTVTSHLRLAKFALFAQLYAGPAAIAYAALHPENVTHLILWHSFARTSDYTRSSRVQMVHSLLNDWDLFLETLAHAWVGWAAETQAHRLANLIRSSVDQSTMRSALNTLYTLDVTDQLPSVQCPTLILYRDGFTAYDLSIAENLASHILRSEVLQLHGEASPPYAGDANIVARAIQEFISRPLANQSADYFSIAEPPHCPLTNRERTILYLIADGMTNHEIATRLSISLSTVKAHLNNLYSKLGVTSRSKAVAHAHHFRLLEPPHTAPR